MAQQTKGLAASADDPSLIPGTRMVETELAPPSCPRTPTYALCCSLSLPPLPSQIHNESRPILKKSSAQRHGREPENYCFTAECSGIEYKIVNIVNWERRHGGVCRTGGCWERACLTLYRNLLSQNYAYRSTSGKLRTMGKLRLPPKLRAIILQLLFLRVPLKGSLLFTPWRGGQRSACKDTGFLLHLDFSVKIHILLRDVSITSPSRARMEICTQCTVNQGR